MKINLKYFLILCFILSFAELNAQSGKSYYVNTQILNFRKEPNEVAEIMYFLNLYDNIKVIDSVHFHEWSKIIVNRDTGYVAHKFLNKGYCVVHTYNVKTGVQCKDGTVFEMLNKNICASHGGFSNWIYEPRKSVQIVKE